MITIREKFKENVLKSFKAIQQRDAKIFVLKTKLEKANSEALGVVELHMRVSELEATAATKAEELASLSVQNAKLSGKVSGLESVRDGLMGKVVELESECEYLLNQALDARLSKLSYQGLEAGVEGVEHGKAGRDLSASYKDVPLERVIEDETPTFRKLQPILEQGSLGGFPARAQRHRLGPSPGLVVTEVATSGPNDSSLATTGSP
ncbi:hypothetical protein Tco_0911795 [Tanacetum coccineum]